MSDGSSGVGWIISLTVAAAIGLALYVSYQGELRLQSQQQEARREAEEARRLREQELAAEQHRIDTLSPVDRDIYELQYLRYLQTGFDTVSDNPEYLAFQAWTTTLLVNLPENYQSFIDTFPESRWTGTASRIFGAQSGLLKNISDVKYDNIIMEARNSWLAPLGGLDVSFSSGYGNCADTQKVAAIRGYVIVTYFYRLASREIAERFDLSADDNVFSGNQDLDSFLRGSEGEPPAGSLPQLNVKSLIMSIDEQELRRLIGVAVALLGDNADEVRAYLVFLLESGASYVTGPAPELSKYGDSFLASPTWTEPYIRSGDECFNTYWSAQLTLPAGGTNWVGVTDNLKSLDTAATSFWRRRVLEGSQGTAERLLRYTIEEIDRY